MTILSVFFTLLTFVACDLINGPDIKTADFSVDHESTYLTKPIVFTAKDSLGGNEYSWSFGDGNTETGKYKVTHTYEKGGTYIAFLTVNGFKSYRVITVYKGTLSFKIVNKSSKYLNCLTYIDNYNGSVSRFGVSMNSQSDTIYGANLNFGDQHLFGISLFIKNSEYTLPNLIWLKNFQHYNITVTDTTKVVPRSGFDFPDGIMIKDL